MTTAEITTVRPEVQKQPEHVVTINTLGQFTCTCRIFKANFLMYGERTCLHTDRIVELQEAH